MKTITDPSNSKFEMHFELEVHEKSRLFQNELATSKAFMSNTVILNEKEKQKEKEVLERQEKLRKEIMEKERQLKEMLEKERQKIEVAEKQRVEAERKKKEQEMMEAERFEKERLEKEKRDQEQIEKDQLKVSVSNAVIDAVNTNIERIRNELIEKAIMETTKAVENSMSKSQIIKKNDTVHQRHSCNNCGMFPIVGNRFHCTVCYDYDLCEDCEVKTGDSHGHALVKHRKNDVPQCFPQRCFPQHPMKNRFFNKNNIDKNIYKTFFEMKKTYDLSKFKDQEVIQALFRSNGDVDLALESLFR